MIRCWRSIGTRGLSLTVLELFTKSRLYWCRDVPQAETILSVVSPSPTFYLWSVETFRLAVIVKSYSKVMILLENWRLGPGGKRRGFGIFDS